MIIPANKITSTIQKLKKQNQTVVLVGGCFDILHPGHVVFLEKAKKMGDILVVLLESDQKVKLLKGEGRPIHTQKERAKVLSALKAVDVVIRLGMIRQDSEYDRLVTKIQPDVIAATSKDGNITHHKRAAHLVGAKLKLVTKVIGNHSTSSLTSSITVK